MSIALRADSPLVVTGTNSGFSNFIVDLIPRGGGDSQGLINEIGPYEGQAAVADITSGKYRVKIDAEGVWTLKFEQPVPTPRAKVIPGTIKGRGARVVPVQVLNEMQPTVSATHLGQSNFIVDLIGYGDLTGDINVFNEIGHFHGETVTDDSLVVGGYLLYVQADGAWTLKFTP